MYFFDPDRGHSRRCRTRDRLVGRARKAERRSSVAVQRRARHLAQRVHGASHAALTLVRPEPRDVDDITLAQKIRSEVLGRAEFDARDVHVDCYHGAAHLRGQVPSDRQVQTLAAAVRRVAGVHHVINDLHIPGTPPPNKAAVIGMQIGHV
jgi:osmotically-inducible protein OsmY